MITKICLVCNKTFTVHNYREDIAKYCSQKCMGSDNKANWAKTQFKDGHESYVEAKSDKRNSVLWNRWREEVFKRDNYTCHKCGEMDIEKILPHHIKSYDKYPKLRLEISNGLTLCRRCHPLYHPELKYNLKQYENPNMC